MKAFYEHCLLQKNLTMESYRFNNMVQKEHQPFSEFLTELRTQVDRCEFNCTCKLSYEDRMLRDRIITGVFDKKLQLKLLDGRDEKLDHVIDVCKTFEAAKVNKGILTSKQSISAVVDGKTDSVNAVNYNRRFCFNCGGDWKPDHKSKCPAKDSTCQCGKKGHFRKMCRKKGTRSEASTSESKSKEKQRVDNVSWADLSE
ncbi:uncharacterized protein LOC125775549 [Bactrocera dorsalis]|uniref:Uncharacterized protein LOC125775549 n=1 Tax=Bactrocera dorsalis TaxID=27457 RepID=A0ABM3IYW2_BACDO|nr:uncharacterized protein LOC125775549 [Bactrocera dorsalis]